MTEFETSLDEFEEEFEEFEETQETAFAASERVGSLLTVDVGTINTKAALFDMVEGRFRFLAAGSGATTANAPMFDASEGVRIALDQLQAIAGRSLIDSAAQLLIPSLEDGSGADFLGATFSAGAPLKTVVVGLLDKVSMASAAHLANTTYAEIVDSISINDRRKPEEQIDKIQQVKPDVILIAGGTDGGASNSVLKLVNAIGMAIYLLPEENRPEVLYAGNPDLAAQVEGFLEPLAPVHIAPNIRPGLAAEQLGGAQAVLTNIFRRIHTNRILGVHELNTWSGGSLLPSSHGLGRVVRFFSQIIPNAAARGVLGVDVGASNTIVAAGFNGDLRTRVFTRMGVGAGLTSVLEGSQMEDVLRWIPGDIPPLFVLDYIQNKITRPATVPATPEELYIEQALAREVMRRALESALPRFPKNASRLEANLLPAFDPILVGGAALANAPSPAHSLLIALDALQPTGIQRIILDKNYLAPGLGAAAAITPGLVAQLLLDPTAFLNLGFVISPIANTRPGVSVLRARIQYETGHESVINVHQGSIQTIPLPIGQRARLFLDPLHRANIGFGPGRGTSLQVVGGPFGVVVDARGRPLALPKNSEKRHNLLRKWEAAFHKGR